ncbi:MAG: hypothetical protein GX591_14045 [Planctomycetes bacterium]|nr:hypothetical protein [Planctomycetota bacterium]
MSNRPVPRDTVNPPDSTFDGFDDAHGVRGVSIENLSFNGRRATTLEEAGVKIGPHVEGVAVE